MSATNQTRYVTALETEVASARKIIYDLLACRPVDRGLTNEAWDEAVGNAIEFLGEPAEYLR